MVIPKVPAAPRRRLTLEQGDLLDYTGVLWRIHRTEGEFVAPWDVCRRFGPLGGMRYDPHPAGGPAVHPNHGVHYNAVDVDTAVAEVFQRTRTVNVTNGVPFLTGWSPVEPLRLLDLTSAWTLRNGAADSLQAAPRSVCRAWARAIHEQLPGVEGLYVRSTMTGGANVVLWERAEGKLPAAPRFHRPLTSAAALAVIGPVATRIGYRVVA